MVSSPIRGAGIRETKDLGNKNYGYPRMGTQGAASYLKFLHGSALLTETLGKTGIKSSKQVEEQKSAESRRYQLSRREKFGSSSLSPENIKPGSKSCSGTQRPTPTNPCREQQEAPLKLTRHLLAFLEVERVFQYNKQRGHTWVMESFHIQAEQVPLSCFISSIRSSQNPTGLRCPPRG